MLAKIPYIRKILSTFRHTSLHARGYLAIRLMLLPHDFLSFLESNLSKKENILDVGCGYGLVTLFLSYIWHEGKIMGVDIDAIRIRDLQALPLPSNISFLERDLIGEGFSGLEWYDTAIMVDILHHLDEPTQVALIAFLAKQVKTLIIKDIDTTPRYKYLWNYFHDRYVMRNDILCFLGSARIRTELEKNGFTVEPQKITSPFPYPHYMFVARR